ncbi:MAG: putative baseplate assembly protein [Candidatus Angelobacter sp. Gp1-AA117]|nr:MAG: putative baseplate assembly protein [Candidatus Angelobacter sp. Gp1-AA117]
MSTQYFCLNQQRRAKVLKGDTNGNPVLNGIDFLEVSSDQKTLSVTFLFNLPGTTKPVPPSPAPALTVENIVIDGGVRITGIKATQVKATRNALAVTVSAPGDFSTYTLRLVAGPNNSDPPAGFDPQLSSVDFSFKVQCPSDFDCKQQNLCPPPALPQAEISYLAKDFASFRQLLLDRMARTMPAWQERNPADIGIALVELLAYAGDQLSYFQDAVATEAYLGTARRRISVRRHARLLDYFMHEGCNARAWVFFEATSGPGFPVPSGTTLLTQAGLPRGIITEAQRDAALNQGSQAFQTLSDITLHQELNKMSFYTWSDGRCCLPKGAARATLKDEGAGDLLKKGDLLLLEEVKSPATGAAEDANPAHRHVVRLTRVAAGVDPLDQTRIVEIEWDAADALPFPLCLSTVIEDQKGLNSVADVSVACGNLVLADQGLQQPAENLPDITANPYRPLLKNTDITFQAAFDNQQACTQPATGLLLQDPQQTLPAITLRQNGSTWTPRRDLLSSGRNALDFVVETDDDGTSILRFGDGLLGSKPVSGLKASYRTGNGSAGNVGAEAIAHAVKLAASTLAGIKDVRNPLPAQGGIDPEPVDQVRSFAPWAFRVQERAVTEADYAAVAQRHPEIQKAQATLRWTGSWYTMFVTVDRKGGKPVDAAFRARIRNFIDQFRLAAYDLEIEAPIYVPLDIAFTVCVQPGYFRSSVKAALLDVFSSRQFPDGRLGFFHPDNFTFRQPVFLSTIVAAAMQVSGVRWIDTNDIPPAPNHFKRLGRAAQGETAAGEISLARLEIARLDNDPSQPENGKLEIFLDGGL